MKRLPYWSNDRLGSQHASPRLSLFPINFVVQFAPPSKLTPSSIPAAGCSTFVTITMLFGLVGLTATVSSHSLVDRWLTSTFGGTEASCNWLLVAAACAWLGCRCKLMPSVTAPTRTTRPSSERIRLLLECRVGYIESLTLQYSSIEHISCTCKRQQKP